MKLSYTTLAVQDKTLEQAVQIAIDHRLEGIELRGKDNVHVSPVSSFAYVREAKKRLDAAGLKLPCLTAYTRFFQPTREEAYRQAEELLGMLELAEYLGASTVRTFMGAVPEGMPREKVLDISSYAFNHAVQRMGSCPVKVVIETHDSVKNAKSLLPLLQHVPCQVGVLLDIIHPWDTEEPVEETLRLIGDRIYHVHIKDILKTVPGGRIYCRIGKGRIPVQHIVSQLLAFG